MASRSGQRRTVRLVHFADYHAHAVPFYSEGDHAVAGAARLIAYLRSVRPGAVVTNGGDMFNIGSPAWSDRYQGREWPWFNGLVDVMAFGNHDSDYGPEVFDRCRRAIDHPILCANLVDDRDEPVLTVDGRSYLVHEVDGVRIGLLSAAGPDIDGLVPADRRPIAGARFVDRTELLEQLLATMRRDDRVDAVVLIGHGLLEDDVALAKEVPGIDLVLGTHSHRLQDLSPIPGTEAMTISPFQYGTYVADLRLSFQGGALLDVSGGLVRMGPDRPQAADIAARVDGLAAQLATDPAYAYLFEQIAHAPRAIRTEGQELGESELGNLVADVLRAAAGADIALLSSSTLRESIPPGPVRVGDIETALPYPNQLVVYRLPGRTVQALLDVSARHAGTSFHAQVSGLRVERIDGRAARVHVQARDQRDGWSTLESDRDYEVALNDFTADAAPGYREILAGAGRRDTGLEVRRLLTDEFRRTGHARGALDGRIVAGVVGHHVVR